MARVEAGRGRLLLLESCKSTRPVHLIIEAERKNYVIGEERKWSEVDNTP